MLTKALENKLPGRWGFQSHGSECFKVQSLSCEQRSLAKKNRVSVFMKKANRSQREAQVLAGFGHRPSRKEHVDSKEALAQHLQDPSYPHFRALLRNTENGSGRGPRHRGAFFSDTL